ncbi:MAG: DUF4416 family protein [Acidobacteria bacterium]|nr:DUF4416 family protein [Acidobacteriota bacterium]
MKQGEGRSAGPDRNRIHESWTPPQPATLFVALLYAPARHPEKCVDELTRRFGPVACASACYSMASFTSYYEREMGPGLQKQFIAFQSAVAMDRLADYKLATRALEAALQYVPGRRGFNLDPGLVTRYSVILSTSKNHAHRIYLRDGVFAEVTLIFRERRYHPLPWTYSDYQAPLALNFFAEVRPK